MTKGRFLEGELRERGGVRARAKKFVIPQREKDAGEVGMDNKIREVSCSYPRAPPLLFEVAG